jgi:hypothetical protein
MRRAHQSKSSERSVVDVAVPESFVRARGGAVSMHLPAITQLLLLLLLLLLQLLRFVSKLQVATAGPTPKQR